MLVVIHRLACQDVGQVVEVDDDVAVGGVLAGEGGFSCGGTKEAP
ncbi:hypothetical protein [Corynebacterium striatum]|nr:hypothetical protein [Corynebacterium striatum]